MGPNSSAFSDENMYMYKRSSSAIESSPLPAEAPGKSASTLEDQLEPNRRCDRIYSMIRLSDNGDRVQLSMSGMPVFDLRTRCKEIV